MAPKVSENYKEEKKKALLNFARTAFAEKGYLKTSMQDIMDKANISSALLCTPTTPAPNLLLFLLPIYHQLSVAGKDPSQRGIR